MLCEKPVLPAYILIPDRDSKSQKENTYLQVCQRMKFTVRNSHMYSCELFKYVSVRQSATGHIKTTVKTRGTIKTKRWQSFVCQMTCRWLQYAQDLKVESIWSIALNLESVAGSSRFWYNILVFLLLEEKEKSFERAVAF